jgi:hypothetical protein
MREIGGAIVVRPHEEHYTRRAPRPDQTLDREGIEAGEGVDRYLIAKFTRTKDELPLHQALSGKWFRAAGGVVSSIGSGA